MPFAPTRGLQIDNRPVQAQFMDSNPISEGFANLASSVLNAGPEAAQIRMAMQQRAQQEKDKQDAMALSKLYHQQSEARANKAQQMQIDYHKSLMDNLAADNAARDRGQFGTVVNETAKRAIEGLKVVFGGHGSNAKDPVKRYQLKEHKDAMGRVIARTLFDPQTGETQDIPMNDGIQSMVGDNIDAPIVPQQSQSIDQSGGQSWASKLHDYLLGSTKAPPTQHAFASQAIQGLPQKEDPVQVFIKNGGFDAAPDSGIDINNFLSNDPKIRAAEIMKLPTPMDRIKTIEALQKMGMK